MYAYKHAIHTVVIIMKLLVLILTIHIVRQ